MFFDEIMNSIPLDIIIHCIFPYLQFEVVYSIRLQYPTVYKNLIKNYSGYCHAYLVAVEHQDLDLLQSLQMSKCPMMNVYDLYLLASRVNHNPIQEYLQPSIEGYVQLEQKEHSNELYRCWHERCKSVIHYRKYLSKLDDSCQKDVDISGESVIQRDYLWSQYSYRSLISSVKSTCNNYHVLRSFLNHHAKLVNLELLDTTLVWHEWKLYQYLLSDENFDFHVLFEQEWLLRIPQIFQIVTKAVILKSKHPTVYINILLGNLERRNILPNTEDIEKAKTLLVDHHLLDDDFIPMI